MFTCKNSIERLLEFLDGELSEEESQHLEAHLVECPPCVDFVRTYQATPKLCRRALGKEMPRALATKLTEFLRAKCKK